MENVHLDYRPAPWPRCIDRKRVAEIPVNGKRRICAELHRDSNGDELVTVWPEIREGRNWRQVGRAFPLPAAALEMILEGYWSLGS